MNLGFFVDELYATITIDFHSLVCAESLVNYPFSGSLKRVEDDRSWIKGIGETHLNSANVSGRV